MAHSAVATTPYHNKYVSDIPLKRPQETFVDDPCSLEEVSLADLEFDLANNIKDINRLHIFHAIAVFSSVLNDLILLSGNRELLEKFRKQRLEAYQINMDSLEKDLLKERTGFHDDDLPLPLDPPQDHSEYKESSIDASIEKLIEELIEKLIGNLIEKLIGNLIEKLLENFGDLQESESYVSLSNQFGQNKGSDEFSTSSDADELLIDVGAKPPQAFISTELLIQTTSLEMLADPITAHSNERLRKEVLYHMTPKIKQQAELLVRCFGLAKAPSVTIEQFLARIKQYSPSVSVSVYIHSAYMLFKLTVLLDVMQLTPLNVYRFILALIRCLTKKLEDIYQKQQNFATVGGVAPKDLRKIEVSFLYLLNFKLVVSEYILNQFLTKEFVALRAFCKDNFKENE